jgi:hypothetical protein
VRRRPQPSIRWLDAGERASIAPLALWTLSEMLATQD